MTPVFLVPRGAEAAAVRRGSAAVPIVEIRAGRRAGDGLPRFAQGDAVVVLGLCGSLRNYRVGDVVVYRTLAGDGDSIDLDAPLADAALAALPRAHGVRGCSADHVITRAPERATVAARYDADVVDMESDALAPRLRAGGVRFAIVRVVSDDPGRDLPTLDHAIRADGGLDILRIAAAFVRDPRGAGAFARDARAALRALTQAAQALTSLAV